MAGEIRKSSAAATKLPRSTTRTKTAIFSSLSMIINCGYRKPEAYRHLFANGYGIKVGPVAATGHATQPTKEMCLDSQPRTTPPRHGLSGANVWRRRGGCTDQRH